MNEPKLTHVDASGKVRKVDVPNSARVAIARGEIQMKPETLKLIRVGAVEKGDVLTVA